MPGGSKEILIRLKRTRKKQSHFLFAKGLTQKASKRREFERVARPALRDGFERGCSFEEACRFAVARYVSHYVELESLGLIDIRLH